MNDGLIPQRYAMALYKFACDKKNTPAVYDEMKLVIESFKANPKLCEVLANPFVARADKEKLLLAAAGTDLEDDYRSFVKLILDHNREEYALQMAYAFRDIFRRENHISQVHITTAVKFDEAELDKLRQLVQKAYSDRTLEFTYSVNPEIIGGFIIDVDMVRMDASLSNEIEQLRQNLLRSN